MKSYFYILLFLSLFPSFIPLFASFSEIEVYKTPLQQPIFFLDDAHNYRRERDGHYFSTLLKIFEEADNDPAADPDTTEYVVFVENGASLQLKEYNYPQFDHDEYILENLYETVQKKPFKRTKVIDCNPRKVSRALGCLFGSGESLFFIFRRNPAARERFKAIHTVDYFDVTFHDVANSFDALKNQMLEYRSQWTDPKILDMFDSILNRLQIKYLLNLYAEYGIDQNQSIFDYLGNTNRFDKRRELFDNRVTNIFCEFVDLFILHHLLLEKSNPKIKKFIIIAGSAHTGEVKVALEKLNMGYERVYREGPSSPYIHLFFKENGLRLLQAPLSDIRTIKRNVTWKDDAQIMAFLVIISGIIYLYYY